MMKLRVAWTPDVKWLACGVNVSSSSVCEDWKNALAQVAPGFFPPEIVVQVKALVCELPKKTRSAPFSME
jgi:hypothetical protein